jgi:hypothetical protein
MCTGRASRSGRSWPLTNPWTMNRATLYDHSPPAQSPRPPTTCIFSIPFSRSPAHAICCIHPVTSCAALVHKGTPPPSYLVSCSLTSAKTPNPAWVCCSGTGAGPGGGYPMPGAGDDHDASKVYQRSTPPPPPPPPNPLLPRPFPSLPDPSQDKPTVPTDNVSPLPSSSPGGADDRFPVSSHRNLCFESQRAARTCA